nr:putative ribonuclease H-like domain-containing protein [Tanacetum cinerariifolium]
MKDVAFGRNPKGGKITGKGKIKTGKLDFYDVYFVNELKFNLFSVSQMCDKKNNVLFTDTECVVLSSNFKLLDENHVLLRVPRENNMYNADQTNIKREFSVARTPQQNGVAERKNRTLIEAARTMLADSLLPISFWAEEVINACYVQNRSMNYQPVVAGNQPNHSADADATFDVKKNENEVQVSPSSSDKPQKHDEKAKREANGKSHVDLSTGVRDLRADFEEFLVNSTNRVNVASAPVTVVGPNLTNNTNSFNAASPFDDVVSPNFEIGEKYLFVDPSQYPNDPDMPALEDIVYSDDEEDVGVEADFSNLETNIFVSPITTTIVHKDHPVSQIIGELTIAPRTRSMAWMGHTQKENIDYKEVFAPLARIEAIRLFLAYASFMGFMVYQMDVKSAFLYGTIEEEVYVCQPPGFEDPDYPDKVYKVVKALYGLHQAPRAWYETLANYLLENSFQRGKIDQTLFIKKQKGDILLV